jgi:excisionase family DNA binding protein
MDPLLTAQQVADLLGKSPQWVATAARNGDLPARKVGRQWRWTEADVAAFVESLVPAATTGKPITRRRRERAA